MHAKLEAVGYAPPAHRPTIRPFQAEGISEMTLLNRTSAQTRTQPRRSAGSAVMAFAALLVASGMLCGCVVETPGYYHHDGWWWHHHHD